MPRLLLDLTKDERSILDYVVSVAANDDGDPLKDVYELGDDRPEDSYGALRTLAAKLAAAPLDAADPPTDHPPSDLLAAAASIANASEDGIGIKATPGGIRDGFALMTIDVAIKLSVQQSADRLEFDRRFSTALLDAIAPAIPLQRS
jgi:hypothetical protein